MTATNLPEALAWLDYCLEETTAAMGAVKAAALESKRSPGGTPGPPGAPAIDYHAVCEMAAEITILRGRILRVPRHGGNGHVVGGD